MTYLVLLSRQAKRALTNDLPEVVAAACYEFIFEILTENPQRVGKQLQGPLLGLFAAKRGEFHIVYRIEEAAIVVHLITIRHRRDVYRS